MKKHYTHISVILDRSGSMESIRTDIIAGFNNFLRKQQAEPGLATLTLVQFDSQDPYEIIHRFKRVADVPELTPDTYVPRGGTPLLDAIGRGINDLEQGLGEISVKNQPENVIMVIVTDGQENQSREFGKIPVEKMIKEKSGWQFVFLSADLAAMDDARAVGIHDHSSLAFSMDTEGCASAWEAVSKQACDVRSGLKNSVEFENGDRKHPKDPNRKKAK